MQVLTREDAGELWNQWWEQMSYSWFKLEVLQDYSAEDDNLSLRAWKDGEHDKSIELLQQMDPEWVKMCQEKAKQGLILQRVHVVDTPYTPYIQWEIQCYKHVNIPLCGEKVSLLNRKQITNLILPSGDMMVFDDKKIVVNTYENDFMTKAEFYDKTDKIQYFLDIKKQILKKSSEIAI